VLARAAGAAFTAPPLPEPEAAPPGDARRVGWEEGVKDVHREPKEERQRRKKKDRAARRRAKAAADGAPPTAEEVRLRSAAVTGAQAARRAREQSVHEMMRPAAGDVGDDILGWRLAEEEEVFTPTSWVPSRSALAPAGRPAASAEPEGKNHRVRPNSGPTLRLEIGNSVQSAGPTCDFWANPVNFRFRQPAARRGGAGLRPTGVDKSLKLC
jgi:hypothetical protein